MDGIITIVIIAFAVIFKLVDKKLKGVSGDEVFPTITVDPDLMKEPEEKPLEEPLFEEAPRVFVKQTPDKPVEKQAEEPILVEEEKKTKEKIDPKKMVVYSEIMKPKFKDEN